MNLPINQCMGCQAGWPIKTRPEATLASGRVLPAFDSHEVVGGYPFETVACTRSRYQETNNG